MKKITYITLAAARMADTEGFDAAIKASFIHAVNDVGKEIAIRAIYQSDQNISTLKTA